MFRAARQMTTVGALAAILLAGSWLCGQQQAQATGTIPFAVVTEKLPQPVAHTPYQFQLVAQGGVPPYTWEVQKGELPPGLHLDGKTGFISGMTTGPAKLALTVRVVDAAEPPHVAVRDITITSVPALELEWQRQPVLENDGIYGAVKVANPSKDPYDLTFIIVAVNEVGKAFALGYERFNLRPQAQQAIPFGASLPLGSYIVHADAVGEIAAKDVIRRAQLQTPEPLVKK